MMDIESLIAQIHDGDLVALPASLSGTYSGAAMSATRALIRRGVKGLHLLGVPALSYQADLLIGAGCVGIVEAGSILLYEYGPASRFVAAQKAGTVEVRDTTCPAIQAALVASEKGIPFMPLRGIIGSDLLKHHERRGDWRVTTNPFDEHDRIVAVAAIRPDITLFHAPLADTFGNVWIGRREDISAAARASTKALATVDAIYDGNLMDSDELAPGTLPSIFVTAISHQPQGSWPLRGYGNDGEDAAHLHEYARLARSEDGFAEYLERFLTSEPYAFA